MFSVLVIFVVFVVFVDFDSGGAECAQRVRDVEV
jgi:hypothetical protein